MMIVAAVVSIVTIVPWWNAWPQGSLIGALLIDVAVIIALLPPWGDQLSKDSTCLTRSHHSGRLHHQKTVTTRSVTLTLWCCL